MKIISRWRHVVILGITAILFAICVSAHAQEAKISRIGVLVPGPAWYEIIDGLRSGLKELGVQEGKQFSLTIRDWNGEITKAETAARKLEQEKFDLLYATSTNSTLAN